MTTERQITANRANAKLSTGPRTEAGKAVSRCNALKHGLTAPRILLDGEDPNEFEDLRQALCDKFRPEDTEEELLVDSFVGLLWRLRRVPEFEAMLLRLQERRPMPTGENSILVNQDEGGQRALRPLHS